MSCDIVIASIPKTSIESPLLAPSLLKSVLKENGFNCKVFDWNYELYDKTKGTELELFLNFNSDDDLSFSDKNEFDIVWNMGVKNIAIDWVKEIEIINPKWFGISLFSNNCIYIAIKILELLREKLPHLKIVAGSDGVRSQKMRPTIGEYLKEKNLIDHYIVGEAENSIVHLLNGDLSFKGIDGNECDIVDLNTIPIPDYSDLDMDKYSNIWIMGSRGCINRCAFCDANEFYKTFRCRNGIDVANEMTYLNKKYNISFFNFSDNLVNGNLKFFRELCKNLKLNKCGWYGQTICNPKMTEDDFRNAKQSGLRSVTIGIESGVERIRNEMGKTYTNDQLITYLRYLSKYNIEVRASMIIGWFTETEEDFKETLDFLTFCAKEKLLRKVSLGGTLTIGGLTEISPSLPMSKIYNHLISFDKHGKWLYKKNTMKVRLDRWKRMRDHCLSIGFITQQQKYTQMDKLFKMYYGESL
jgi:hypothetical protein